MFDRCIITIRKTSLLDPVTAPLDGRHVYEHVVDTVERAGIAKEILLGSEADVPEDGSVLVVDGHHPLLRVESLREAARLGAAVSIAPPEKHPVTLAQSGEADAESYGLLRPFLVEGLWDVRPDRPWTRIDLRTGDFITGRQNHPEIYEISEAFRSGNGDARPVVLDSVEALRVDSPLKLLRARILLEESRDRA